jgi:hypothetical protein
VVPDQCRGRQGSPRGRRCDRHLHDLPFLQTINGQPFATVPYSVHLNDIASFDFPGFNPAAYQQQLTDEFDQLYAEGAHRRRMMVIGLHERLSGHASRSAS